MAVTLSILLLAVFHQQAVLTRADEQKLVMTHVVYRHGDRSPIHSLPNDPHKNYWPQGPGQLTQIGMNQEYHLGQFFKKRYITDTKLLNETYLRKQVRCRSSDRDRTLMSAEAQMAGLFPPEGRQLWNNDIRWQPIPVHTVPRSEDVLLRPWDVPCPTRDKIVNQFFASEQWKKLEREYADFLKYINDQSGGNYELKTIGQAHDALFCEKAHNLTIPEWAQNETVWKTLRKISYFDYEYLGGVQESKKFFGGSLVGDIVHHMKDYKDGKEELYKMYIYSGHDTSIMSLLQALDLYDSIPPYSSAVLVELYKQEGASDLIVKIMYRNSSSVADDPLQFKMKDCSSEDCPLNEFIKITAHVIPKDLKRECGIEDQSDRKYQQCGHKIGYSTIVAALVVVSLAAVLLIGWILCTNMRRKRRYARHLIDPDAEQLIKEVAMMGGGVSGSDGELSDS